MKITRPSFPTVVLAGSLLVLASAAVVVLAAAQTQGGCPAVVASILPKNASNLSGQYFPGDLGQGTGSADLILDNSTCPKQKFSARLEIEFKYYVGKVAVLIKSSASPYGSVDRDADKALAIENGTRELERTRLTPKIEKLGIGEIVYVERMTECPPEGPAAYAARVGPMIVPNVKLRGVAWTNNARVKVKLDGLISVDLAKAAVAEVFENLKRTDFSKAK